MEYNQVIEIKASALEEDTTKKAFAQLNWIPVDSLIKTLQQMKENNRTENVSICKL